MPVAAPDHIRQCIQISTLFSGRADGGTEDLERGAGGRSTEEGGVWEGAVAPPQITGLGTLSPEKFSEINFEIAYFLHYCKLKWSYLQ